VSDQVARSRVLIMAEQPVLRLALVSLLAGRDEIDIVGILGSDRRSLEVARTTSPDIIVLDVSSSSSSAIASVRELVGCGSRCMVIIMSAISDPALMLATMKAGAAGYVLKTQPIQEIVDAVGAVRRGERYLPPHVAADELDALPVPAPRSVQKLSRREHEVFELMIRGYSSDEIAIQLCISRRTVETHRHRVHAKLHARSLLEMIRLAASHCLLGG
jgi:two-component system, NarL family, response regulator NreC